MNDARLFFREGQTTLFQPFHEDFLYLFGIFLCFTKADEIIRIPHDCTFADELAPIVICDADSLFHPVQRNICQQR